VTYDQNLQPAWRFKGLASRDDHLALKVARQGMHEGITIQRSRLSSGRQKKFFLIVKQNEADLPQIKSTTPATCLQAKEKRIAPTGNPLTF
jgi:hypothetical protein